jgi:dephospho-CoA kinase
VSNWPGKFVIGLTGNIGTGKSVVRKMLEHLGAYGIDADALAHRAMAKGAPGYKPVVDIFGKWILDPQGQIDRNKLGKLVFTDPDALANLENIIHPLVAQAVDAIIQRASQPVIAVEAIKLLEYTSLRQKCDIIWVVVAPEEVQAERLVTKRSMSREEALKRIRSQGSQEDKKSAASIVIENVGSFEDTWKQVVAAWKTATPVPEAAPVEVERAAEGKFSIIRGRPRDSAAIAQLITRLSHGTKTLNQGDIMAAFGEKAFLILRLNKTPVGIAGWQVENLVARTTDFYIDSSIELLPALKTLIAEVEQASQDLQCEASLLFLPSNLATMETAWKQLGYERQSPQTLGVQAWQDAAKESGPPNTILFFKQLRLDRILRPI